MNYTVNLLMSQFVTHDVKRFIVSKPAGFSIVPGQGVELAINRSGLSGEGRPFTPTGLGDDRVLEFTIKGYADHADGVTRLLHQLEPGAELLMSEPFGTISYQGPGVFIAGGAGITPFLAILRDLARTGKLNQQTLIFSNKAPHDVICEKELRHLLGDRCILLCSADAPGYTHRRIDRAFLEETITDFDQRFYLCGPPPFMEAVNGALTDIGARSESLVFER